MGGSAQHSILPQQCRHWLSKCILILQKETSLHAERTWKRNGKTYHARLCRWPSSCTPKLGVRDSNPPSHSSCGMASGNGLKNSYPLWNSGQVKPNRQNKIPLLCAVPAKEKVRKREARQMAKRWHVYLHVFVVPEIITDTHKNPILMSILGAVKYISVRNGTRLGKWQCRVFQHKEELQWCC